MQIKNSVVIITGAASGIGETAAREFANAGAKVVLADLNQSELNRIVSEIKGQKGEAAAFVCNVTEEKEVSSLMDFAVNTYGQINVVLANAGIIKDSLMINTDKESGKVKSVMSLESFKSVVEVNLVGVFLTLREGARRMVDQHWPGVFLITSSINKVGQVGQLNYSSTKAAVALWPKILAGEFHMKGINHIRVVGIAPGYVATPILKAMNQKALDAIIKDVHIQRLINPEEITALMKQVVENDGIDATTLEISGGVMYGERTIAK
jgi:3-oxoacyl-[acyl-carrier protein] reductase